MLYVAQQPAGRWRTEGGVGGGCRRRQRETSEGTEGAATGPEWMGRRGYAEELVGVAAEELADVFSPSRLQGGGRQSSVGKACRHCLLRR
jgi:hypothetical protein